MTSSPNAIRRKITHDYLLPAFKPFGLVPRGKCFRHWNSSHSVCALAEYTPLSGCYATVEFAFYSPQIHQWLFERLPESPRPRDCRGFENDCRIEYLLGARICDGFLIQDEVDGDAIGKLWSAAIKEKYPTLAERFCELNGWVTYYESVLTRVTVRRGWFLSLLGYTLLAIQETANSDINRVIEEHEQLPPDEQFECHIRKQRRLLAARFPGIIDSPCTVALNDTR